MTNTDNHIAIGEDYNNTVLILEIEHNLGELYGGHPEMFGYNQNH